MATVLAQLLLTSLYKQKKDTALEECGVRCCPGEAAVYDTTLYPSYLFMSLEKNVQLVNELLNWE